MSSFLTDDGRPRANVIVSSSRSGSNLLVSYLRQVDAAASFGEIFRDDFPQMDAWARLTKRLDLPDDAAALHAERLTDFWELVLGRILSRKLFVSAKIFYYHRRGDPVWDRFGASDHRIIHLWRDSTFDQYVSRLSAVASGRWRGDGASYPSGEPIKIDFDRADYLEFRDQRRQDVKAARSRFGGSGRYLEIEYRQLSDPAFIGGTLESLFGQRVEVEPRLAQQLPRPKIEYLSDPDTAIPFVADTITEGFASG